MSWLRPSAFADARLRPARRRRPPRLRFRKFVDRESRTILSWNSRFSALSFLSMFSFASIGCIGCSGSILSIGSNGSILSIGSAGSILSIGSAGSILSIGAVGGLFQKGRKRRDQGVIVPSERFAAD